MFSFIRIISFIFLRKQGQQEPRKRRNLDTEAAASPILDQEAAALTILFAVRSSQRPAEALKTTRILRRSFPGAEVKVFVEASQMPAYQQVFGDHADDLAAGADGSSGQVDAAARYFRKQIGAAGVCFRICPASFFMLSCMRAFLI